MEQKNKTLIIKLVGAVVAGGVCVGALQLPAMMEAAANGKEIDLASVNAEGYGISAAFQRPDGTYMVEATSAGFQSDITVQVTFDETGSQILGIEIVEQGETDGIGSKITEPDFQAEFAGIPAPVVVCDETPVSPVTGAVGSLTAAAAEAPAEEAPAEEAAATEAPAEEATEAEATEETEAEAPAEDESPEITAIRNLYAAGLLQSNIDGKELVLPSASEAETVSGSSAEEIAMANLYAAGLLQSNIDGKELGVAKVDMTEEEAAAAEEAEAAEAEAEATAETEAAETEAAEEAVAAATTEDGMAIVDGISGATFSSKGTVAAINNAYYFLQEEILK